MKPIYFEKLVTKALEQKILDDQEYAYYVEEIKKDGAGILVQRLLNRLLFQAVRAINSASEEKALPQLTAFCNQLIETIDSTQEDSNLSDEKLSETVIKVIKAQYPKIDSGIQDIDNEIKKNYPFTGLSQSVLFSGGKDNVSLFGELRREMSTSDEIYWLVSFIKYRGIIIFDKEFQELERLQIPIKIICTVYMGATDPKAIQYLSNFKNIEIKISYNTNNERLHAKTYIFKRKSDFNTAYIGSSNISEQALSTGLEWNVKVSSQEVPQIIQKCLETFETYWNDKEFSTFIFKQDWDKFNNAIYRINNPYKDTEQFFVDMTAKPFQQEILDKLAFKRSQGQNTNLVVAATGTGKTVIAAFDFKSFLKANPGANFLFVAHREEILKQAQFTFRQVLRNNDFGELFYGGAKPNNVHHLFATVQTMNSRLESLNISPTFYDYIIIDEVHHSAAKSYDKLLRYFTPKSLLGLTATPERADGEDITRFFANNISAEIRLPEALNLRLLCPFQYFGISDSADLSRVSWRKGKYDTQALENVYTEDTRRVMEILRNCDKYLNSIENVRAIGFCVSIKHAEFMQQEFIKKGIKAGVLTSAQTSERKHIIQQLRRREINFLFVVDILNEGVDIPEVDTLLFLRPTESLTIFLQQLGRGLRIAEGKDYLTVLDFIGQAHAEYSFEHKFRGMIGKTHTKVEDEIENNFPHLPLGCSIVLEKTAIEIVLNNIKKISNNSYRNLLNKIKQFKQDYNVELNLQNFVNYTESSLAMIFYKKRTPKKFFYQIAAESIGNKDLEPINQDQYNIIKPMGETWVSTDTPSYWHFILNMLDSNFETMQSSERQYLLMLYNDLYDKAPQLASFEELHDFFKSYFSDPNVKNELRDYLKIRLAQSEVIEQDFDFGFNCVLKLHGRYTRKQILAALEISTLDKIYPSQEGVLEIKEKSVELFFVTLDKSNWKNTSTNYNDYFINEDLFHWESQNKTSENTPRGKSYINHKKLNKRLFLFVREREDDENKNTMSYVFCGSLEYLSHTKNKPMSINWRLEQRPPAALYSEGRKLAIG